MLQLDEEKIKWLREKARDIRVSIIEMLAEAKSGHPGGALGMADIFAALFFHILKHDPTNPMWEERDRLIVSNGHICPVYYSALAHAGYFPLEELRTLRKLGSRLQGHPDRRFLPFTETTSGPLGCGLSQAVGMSLADKMDRGADSARRFYCILSDAELQEGNIWEAAMLAGKEKLKNLIAIIDRNKIQLSGNTEDIMPLEPLSEKWLSFGWEVREIDGHDFREIVPAVANASLKPLVIIASTVPGKGVSFMENEFTWHGQAPSQEEAALALKELNQES